MQYIARAISYATQTTGHSAQSVAPSQPNNTQPKAPVNHQHNEQTLFKAIQQGNSQQTQQILDAAPIHGTTLQDGLVLAAQHNHLGITQQLLAKQPPIHVVRQAKHVAQQHSSVSQTLQNRIEAIEI